MKSSKFSAAIACAAGLAASASAQQVQVIYTKIPSSPTSVIPGTLDLVGQPAATNWRALEDIAVKADGSEWVVKGRTQLGSDLETILVRGSGTAGTMFTQEGQPYPAGIAGELYDFFDTPTPVTWDTTGRMAFSFRARGGVANTLEKIVIVDALNVMTQVLQQGAPLVGCQDIPANPSGDELLGNSVGSVQMMNDGTVAFGVTPITNSSSFRYPAHFRNNTKFRQAGVDTLNGGTFTWKSPTYDDGRTTPDGTTWMLGGTIDGQTTATDLVLAVNDTIVLREGSALPSSALLVGDITQTLLAQNGTWAARGRDNSATTAAAPDWFVINGALIVLTGDSVNGGTELWGDTFSSIAVNNSGDWALAGKTNNANLGNDEVIVINGQIVMREGDAVDVNGNGLFDDDAFIGRGTNTLAAFAANDLQLADDGWLYAVVNLRNGAGLDLNTSPSFGTPDAFVRVRLPDPAVAYCFGDDSGTLCPCGNPGAAGNGCASSMNPNGANLAASGVASVSTDSFVLTGSGMPNNSALYFQGTTQLGAGAGVVFGDGLRCVGGSIIRLGTRTNVAGSSQFPDVGTLSISVKGNNVAGGSRNYQTWYRNPANYCTPDPFNLTNGISVTWGP